MTVSELKAIAPHIPLILCFLNTGNKWTLAHDERFGSISNELLDFKVLRLGAVNSEFIQVYIDYPTSQNVTDESDSEFNDYHIALNG